MLTAIRGWIRRIEWRVKIILVGWFLSVLFTAIVWLLPQYFPPCVWFEPSTFVGAIFAGWIGGVLLLSVVGAPAAIVSLVGPEYGTFDYRARVLFRRQSGPHIDYIVSTLQKQLEHYSERTDVDVAILSHHSGEKKFRIADHTKYAIRSYVDDFPTAREPFVEYREVTEAPAGAEPNRLVYVRVDGVPVGEGAVIEPQGLTRIIKETVGPNQTVDTEILAEYWVHEGEENSEEPVRYTQLMTIQFENRCDLPVTVNFGRALVNEERITLASGSRSRRIVMSNLRPDDIAYRYSLGA